MRKKLVLRIAQKKVTVKRVERMFAGQRVTVTPEGEEVTPVNSTVSTCRFVIKSGGRIVFYLTNGEQIGVVPDIWTESSVSGHMSATHNIGRRTVSLTQFHARISAKGECALVYLVNGADQPRARPIWIMGMGDENLSSTQDMDLGFILRDIDDFQWESSLTINQIREKLQFYCRRRNALFNFFAIILDPDTAEETRIEMLERLEEDLAVAEIAEWMRVSLISEQCPVEYFQDEAIDVLEQFPNCKAFFEEFRDSQVLVAA